MSRPKPLSRAELEELLQRRKTVRAVASLGQARHRDLVLTREEAMECALQNGAFLSGPAAREHNFGVCFTGPDNTVTFLETGHD